MNRRSSAAARWGRLLAAGMILILGASAVLAEPADTVYRNGSIITMVGEAPEYAQALAVKEGRIAFVGPEEDAVTWIGESTQVIDLDGKTLLPGFLDSHSHYINALLVARQCKLYAPPAGPGKDVPSIIAELERCAEDTQIADGELLIGYGYDDTVMPDGRLLNRDDLDEAFPNHPVRVDHVSMHGAVLNSLALEKYGFSAETQTPPGGVIVRKPGTNEPWGLIMETAFLPVFEQTEPMTAQQEIEFTRAAQMLYAQAGITTAHEGATHLPQLQTMLRATEAGANIIDVVAYPFITDLEKILAEVPREQWGQYDRGFKLGGVKITLDGSPQGRTAYFTTPYLAGGPAGEENWLGEPTFPQELVNQAFKRVFELGLPLNAHTNGDAAIDMFLAAYEAARNGDFSTPWNVTTIHTQFMRPDHIPRFVEYGVRPSFYTLHTYYFAEAHLNNRGPEQAMYISPMRDAIDAGLRPTNHTDFVVAPLDQMFVLWSAVNRTSRAGAEIGPDQRVSPYEGLKTMTAWAAEQYGEQASKGTLEVGKLADLVVLDRDPLTVEPAEIMEIKVVETIKAGTTIYPKPEGTTTPVAAGDPSKTYTWRAHICDKADVNSAAGREWTLRTLNGQRVSTEQPPTMMFAGGNLSIFGGVNRLNGLYALIHDRVVMGDLTATRMAGPPELMELEAEFASTLKTVDRFRVHGPRLQLLSGETVVATFQTRDYGFGTGNGGSAD
ncbi:MAG: amidohydrolase family protein [Wenzhouxiangella sp.]